MTQITQVKWNTDKPFQNDVEGKLLLAKWYPDERIGIKDFRSGSGLYWKDIDWSRLSGYSVLSDEPVYCEWVQEKTMPSKATPTCCNDHSEFISDVENYEYKFCPHCGLPIKVIDELKPLPLMGIEPVINVTLGVYQCVWENNGDTIISLADTKKVHAIESWNSLVKKLTGEK